MKNRLLSYLTTISSLAGVELYLLDDGKMLIRYATLRRKSNMVQFEKGEYHFNHLTELKTQIGTHLPIALTISGKGIMHRSLTTVEQWSSADYAKKILPNASLEEFFMQTTVIHHNTLVSFIRKGDITNLLAEFKALGFEILSVTLGPFALVPVWTYLKAPQTGTIRIDAHNFIVNDHVINNYKIGIPLTDHSKKIEFANEEMNECLVTAFGTGLSAMAAIEYPTIDLTSLDVNKEEYNQRSIFKKFAIGMLVFFMLLLLMNTALFMHYSSGIDNNDLETTELLQVEQNELQLDLAKEQELLSSIKRPASSQYGSLARIADLLAASQPLSIILDEMSIFPGDKKESRKIHKPTFNFTLVQLSGTSSDGQELSTWLTEIRKLDFCEKVKIEKYTAVENGNTNFTINLFIN